MWNQAQGSQGSTRSALAFVGEWTYHSLAAPAQPRRLRRTPARLWGSGSGVEGAALEPLPHIQSHIGSPIWEAICVGSLW